MKDNITILLKSIQWIDNEKSETELITKARYEKTDDTIKISYDDTSATGFEGSVTVIEVKGEKNATVMRSGTANSLITLEPDNKHYCHYETPFGDMQIGVYTHKIDNKLDTEKSLYMKYTIDINSAYVSDNEIILKIK